MVVCAYHSAMHYGRLFKDVVLNFQPHALGAIKAELKKKNSFQNIKEMYNAFVIDVQEPAQI